MKLISWNVNGLRACIQKGFTDFFNEVQADFFCLQETKLQEGQIALELPGYEQYWCYAEKKGYSGTAIFARHTPMSVRYGIGIPELDTEGRLITLEYPEFYLVTCYTPNAQRELARLDHRLRWEEAFRSYLKELDREKPVILCGDLNVAHKEIDLKNPSSNRGSAGFSDEERAAFSALLAEGFTDSFRHLHPDATGMYTWWSYMFKARQNNAGWRIDYFVVSDSVKDRILQTPIYSQILGSDHCPVGLEIDLSVNGSIWSLSSAGEARLQAQEKTALTAKAVPLIGAALILTGLLAGSITQLLSPAPAMMSTQDLLLKASGILFDEEIRMSMMLSSAFPPPVFKTLLEENPVFAELATRENLAQEYNELYAQADEPLQQQLATLRLYFMYSQLEDDPLSSAISFINIPVTNASLPELEP